MEHQIGGVVLYEGPDGINLQVAFENETVWLSVLQMSELFGKDRRTILEHLNNIFSEEELQQEATCRNFRQVQIEGGRQVNRLGKQYNLDAIISVGYRVNSKRGTQFRIWASTILRQYLTQGYSLNQRALEESRDSHLKELRQAVELFLTVKEQKALAADEAAGLLDVITTYARSWVLLQQYDQQSLPLDDLNTVEAQPIDYQEVRGIIAILKRELMASREASELFGVERGGAFLAALGAITQTFDGIDLYPSLEEKAAHFLYFVIKDHPFLDGNKRIGSLLFVWFLQRNKYLVNRLGERKVNDNALVALALLVAESRPEQKETMVALVINLIGKHQ